MTNKSNEQDKKEKVVKFPTLAERDRIRKKQEREENEWRKAYRKQNSEPFFNFDNIPPFALYISIAYVAIHLITTLFMGDIARFSLINQWGFVPSAFTDSGGFDLLRLLTPITYNFLHGDWTHIGFNVLMGLALGTFVEKMFSTPTTIKYYFLCGLGGVLIFFAFNPTSDAPVIGASGAISGLFAAALLMMYEQGRLGRLTGKLANKGPWPIIFIWAGIMSFIGIAFGGIAWEAHLGGFLTGALLYRLMRTEKLRL
jgi:membrane associated rhomboid family serine protease